MNKPVIKELTNFDLRAICNSGQVFRMYEREQGVFDVFSGDKYLRVIERTFDGNCEAPGRAAREHLRRYEFLCPESEFEAYWQGYFDLNRDYAPIADKAKKSGDAFICAACEKYAGIRILHQDVWEMMISFIISQQKQIPSIRKCIEGLCKRFGEVRTTQVYGRDGQPETIGWYTFPTAGAIAAGGPDGLKGLSLGYRERYIYETALRYLERGIADEELKAMSYEAAKKYLLSFTGIGEKVANCILLFGAGFVDAFPIDTHIKDILYRCYCGNQNVTATPDDELLPQDKLTQADYEALAERFFAKYSPNRGIVQQWIFAAEIE